MHSWLLPLMLILALCGFGTEDGVTAKYALKRGEILHAEMLVETIPGTADNLLGKQLVRPIFKGKPVTQSDVSRPDLVRRQSQVTVTFRQDGLLLALQGRSLDAGTYGDSIRVLIDGKRRPVSGLVIGHDLVEISR